LAGGGRGPPRFGGRLERRGNANIRRRWVKIKKREGRQGPVFWVRGWGRSAPATRGMAPRGGKLGGAGPRELSLLGKTVGGGGGRQPVGVCWGTRLSQPGAGNCCGGGIVLFFGGGGGVRKGGENGVLKPPPERAVPGVGGGRGGAGVWAFGRAYSTTGRSSAWPKRGALGGDGGGNRPFGWGTGAGGGGYEQIGSRGGGLGARPAFSLNRKEEIPRHGRVFCQTKNFLTPGWENQLSGPPENFKGEGKHSI